VVYGEQIEFTTTQKMPPFVSMVSVVKIAPTAAVLVGKIENLGEGSTYVTKYGHCWSSSVTEPTIQNCEGFSEFPQSSALQEFSTHLTYLNTETTYYVRAYASNEAGITYSTNATFVTKREAFGLLAQLIEVNGGTFNMGLESYFNTRPIHSVTVSDFALSKYEITNDVFATFINEYGTAFIKNGPYKGKSIYVETTDFGGMNYSLKNTNNTWTVVLTDFNTHPIVHVTWYGAYEFCRYYGGRMPTEAEWEYAATGADKSYNYNYSGSNTLDLAGWYGEYSLTPPYGKTHPVGGKQPNEIGTFDMTGNVAEWCSDWYADAYPTTPTTDPQGVITGEYKVVRGGAWSDPDEQLLVRLRKAQKADVHASDIGFRIVFDR